MEIWCPDVSSVDGYKAIIDHNIRPELSGNHYVHVHSTYRPTESHAVHTSNVAVAIIRCTALE